MAIKILRLCLVLGSSFKEFLEFSLSGATVKIAVTNKTLVKTNIPTVTFYIMIFGFVTYIILTRNLTHYPMYKIYTLN